MGLGSSHEERSMKLNMSNPQHGALFNAVTRILGEKVRDEACTHVYFSDRLACTERVLEVIDDWFEQWQHHETLTYHELKEERNENRA